MLAKIRYGSWLYGTNTEKSDLDYYEIVLPQFRQLILNRETGTRRIRFNADGTALSNDDPMTPGGNETTIVPIHKFVHDYLTGQAYAIELAYAIKSLSNCVEFIDKAFYTFIIELISKATTSNVGGMIGFALKQTMDYIHRAERMKSLQEILEFIKHIQYTIDHDQSVRLSYMVNNKSIMEMLSQEFNLEIVDRINNNKPYKALVFNSREYSEYTELKHFKQILTTALAKFGKRVTDALEEQVDYKSLMHAYRVYQQIIELFETKHIQFPRQNVEFLLDIKHGLIDHNTLKTCFSTFDEKCKNYINSDILPKLDSEITKNVDDLLYAFLCLKFMV